MILNILGTDYTLEFRQDVHDRYLRDCDGYCDDSTKEIVVDVMEPEGGGQPEKRNLKEQQKKTIRHEIVHAFLHESGLDTASWAHRTPQERRKQPRTTKYITEQKRSLKRQIKRF